LRSNNQSLVQATIKDKKGDVHCYTTDMLNLSDWRMCAEFARSLAMIPLSFNESTSYLIESVSGRAYPEYILKHSNEETNRLQIMNQQLNNSGTIRHFSIEQFNIFTIALEEALYNDQNGE
jgi:hypothetical protein